MNQKGFGFMQVIGFMCALGLVALYIAVGEPILVGTMEAICPMYCVEPGSTGYAIILGAPVLIIIGGILVLTRPEFYQYGQPDLQWKGPRI